MLDHFNGLLHQEVFHALKKNRKVTLPKITPFVELPGRPILACLAAFVFVLLPALAFTVETPTFGWIFLAVLLLWTVSGVHLVLTHVHLFITLAVLLIGDPFLIATCACWGLYIAIPWYCILLYYHFCIKRNYLINRAFVGWGEWIW